MKTISLPIDIDITDYLKAFNPIVRYAYNRFKDGLTEKDIREVIRSEYYNYDSDLLDSWFVQCAIKEGKSWFSKYEESGNEIIFGGKNNFTEFQQGKISKDEWKKLRLHPISIQGEKLQKGNRKFKLDIIENNRIIFKPQRNKEIIIRLPKLRKNYYNDLCKLELMASDKSLPFSIRLKNDKMSITYDESIICKIKNDNLIENRVLSIDTNPNYLGYSILEIDKNDSDNPKIIDSGFFDVGKLTTCLNLSSDNPLQIKQNNKRKFESFQINKFLINKSIHFKCSKIIIEDLDIKSKDHKKGNKFNRLVNNIWNRNILFTNLNKHCNIYGIDLIKVNCAYTSFIGNVTHGNKYPDPICAAIEIGRRGYFKYQKGKFYPSITESNHFISQWKDLQNEIFSNWTEFYKLVVKILKLKYRSSLKSFKINKDFEVFRLLSYKSNIDFYKFI